MKTMLVASTGGHLAQLMALKPWWVNHVREWVTFDKGSADQILEGETVHWAFHPTTRNIPNALRNLGLAVRLLRKSRPDLLVSTGAGVALPFFLVGRLLRIRTVYIEVVDRIDSRTLTGRLVYPLCDEFAVQWPQQLSCYPSARVIGPLL